MIRLPRSNTVVTKVNALLISTLLPFPTLAYGQSAPTCGWHDVGRDSPVQRVAALAHRRVSEARPFDEAIQQLSVWYSSCNSAAGREAVRLLRNQPKDDPVTQALLGIALVRGPDVQIERSEGQLLRPLYSSSNALGEGMRLLERVTRTQGWVETASELAQISIISRQEDLLGSAAKALQAAYNINPDSRILVDLAEVELARGRTKEAIQAADRAGVPGAMHAKGIAELLQAPDPKRGAVDYLQGLREDEASLQLYFDDLRLVLSADELVEWKSLTEGRAAWIEAQWEWRALMAGISLDERLAVHHRRFATALNDYPRVTYRGAALPTALLLNSPTQLLPLDDRGIMYVRHGEPDHTLRLRPSRTSRTASRIAWIYDGLGGQSSVYEFDMSPDRPGFFLAGPNDVCSGGDGRTGNRLIGVHAPAGDVLDWAIQLQPYDRALSQYYLECEKGDLALTTVRYPAVSSSAVQRAELAINTETAVPELARPLNSAANLYAFKGAAGPELVSYIFFQAGDLSPGRLASGQYSYSLGVRLSSGSSRGAGIVSRDTIVSLVRDAALPPATWLGMGMSIGAPEGKDTRIAIALSNPNDPDQGQVMASSRDIPAFSGDRLMLSDIVIAAARDGVLVRGQHRLAPHSGHEIGEGDEFKMYYELYNTAMGDPLRVSIVIAPVINSSIMNRLSSLISRRVAQSIQFQDVASPDHDGVTRVARTIGSDLTPGSYAVQVRVENLSTGVSAASETNLIVSGR